MGLTKRIFIERDPAYAHVREEYGKRAWADIDKHPFRTPLRRRTTWARSPHWDPFWRGSLIAAAEKLRVSHYLVNDGIRFRTKTDQDRVIALATQLWETKVQTLVLRRRTTRRPIV